MIGKLTGRVDYKGDGHVLLDVNGVGYVVHCSDRTLGALPPRGEVTALRDTAHEIIPTPDALRPKRVG